jgi:hypothetical protein
MALPTIAELEDKGVPRLVFHRKNAVRYWMDFVSWEGLPSDRIFYRGDDFNGRAVLYASGYGVQGDYGNGSVFIDHKYLTEAQLIGNER